MSADSDIAQLYKALKERRQEKRRDSKIRLTERLLYAGVQFESKNYGQHLVIISGDKTIDFWPATAKFNVRGTKKYSCGFNKLLKTIGVQENNNEQ